MKKSSQVTLTVVAAIGLAGCRRTPVDPCQAATFNAEACQEAVHGGGYYYGGHWYPSYYSHPYSYYYNGYHSHLLRGGTVNSASSGSYARPSSGSIARGGFGSTGRGSVGS